MQQIYKRPSIQMCDFNEVTLRDIYRKYGSCPQMFNLGEHLIKVCSKLAYL